MWLEHTTKEAPMKTQILRDEEKKQLLENGKRLIEAMKGKTKAEQRRMMTAEIQSAVAAIKKQRLSSPIANAKTDEEVERILNTPQNKALMKKPQRTKASVSSSVPRSTRSRKLSKPAFETQMEQTLLAAVVKYGNNYQLAKLAGTSADIVSRFARKERTLRLDTAAQIADALGLRFQ